MDGNGSAPTHPRIRGGRPQVESKPELADPPRGREHNGEGENRRASKRQLRQWPETYAWGTSKVVEAVYDSNGSVFHLCALLKQIDCVELRNASWLHLGYRQHGAL